MVISALQVKQLRDKTDAGIMECKAALQETDGDFDKAVVVLRKKGLAAAAKRADRIATEGVVVSYIHPGNKIGVMVELSCETDFVARSAEFHDLAKDIAMHVAAMDPKYIRKEDIPETVLNQEKEIYKEKALISGKPISVVEKIVEGQLSKFYSEVCLYDQPFVKNDKLKVGQLISEMVLSTKENVLVRRFARFKVGEGLEKKSSDFAADVAAQLG
ncbi:MAG TPA: translation elongation factor Ts [Terriglobia bacterium]|nr:translation elongation factor Ts [Terriglobia bacterium]